MTRSPYLRENSPDALAATTKATLPRMKTAIPPASSSQNLLCFFCCRRDGAADGEPFGDPAGVTSTGFGGDRVAGAGVGRSLGAVGALGGCNFIGPHSSEIKRH